MRTYPRRRRGAQINSLIAAAILVVALLGSSVGAAENSPTAVASPRGHSLLSHLGHKKGPAGLPRK